MTILYVETNLLVGVATGRYQDFGSILAAVGAGLRLVIPGVCFFESLVWMEGEIKRRNEFDRLLAEQVSQLQRDGESSHARSLRSLLLSSRIENHGLLKSIDSRLFSAIADVSMTAEAIDVGPADLEQCRCSPIIDELTDNLILHCILRHAAGHPGETKLFLSGNTRDFGSADVLRALRGAGVSHVFSEPANVLGWFRSHGLS